jgi:hypothetical protein
MTRKMGVMARVKSIEIKFDEGASERDLATIMSAVRGDPGGILGPDGRPAKILPDMPDEEILRKVLNKRDDLLWLRTLRGVLVERPGKLSLWERKFVADLVKYQDDGRLKAFSWRQRKLVLEILKKVFG